MASATDIREYAFETYIQPARKRGEKTVTFSANDIHRGLALTARYPLVCSSIDSGKFLDLASVMLISRSGPPQSSSVRWVFAINGDRIHTAFEKQPTNKEDIPALLPKLNVAPKNNFNNNLRGPGTKKVVLISCVKSKVTYRTQAQNLYISTLFRSNLQYAHTLHPDAIYILSAKYGLLELNQEIDPYDLTLNAMSEAQKKAWADQVLSSLKLKTNLATDHFIFLAGINYRKYLLPHIHFYEVPLEGLSFGQQLQELNRRVK